MTPRIVAALAAVGALTLTGCDFGHPGGFTARSNSYCRDTTTVIAKLVTPTSPKTQLQFALDRYTDIERLVSELTDATRPGGTEGDQLNQRWLRPARASLTDGRAVLAQLRSAANAGDRAGATTRFGESLAIGTVGVDAAYLRSVGLTDCADAFGPTTR
jgi:hypothetical protein